MRKYITSRKIKQNMIRDGPDGGKINGEYCVRQVLETPGII